MEGKMGRKILFEHETDAMTLVRVVQADLTQEPVEAIVNAANSQLSHGGGVAGAIVEAGGPEIQRESDRWVDRHGEVATGGAAITGAGRLRCDYVVHAVGPVWDRQAPEEADRLLASAIERALALAAEHDVRTISLPAISTGIFGFPKERGARVILEAVLAAAEEYDFDEINLTNIDAETAQIFSRVAREVLG
jgi:O-acetyl-ADP-ribose deacetylase (regulator of RNase III)